MALITLEQAALWCNRLPEELSPMESMQLSSLINQVSAIICTITELSEEDLLDPIKWRRHLIPVGYCTGWLVAREFAKNRDQRHGIRSDSIGSSKTVYLSDDDIPPFILKMLQPQGSWVA